MKFVHRLLVFAGVASAFIASPQEGPVVPGAYRLMHADAPDTIGAGIILLSELRCSACHALPNAVEASIGWKVRRLNGLIDSPLAYPSSFITAPATPGQSSTMPKYDLTADVASDLAEFVRSIQHAPGFSLSLGSDVERGADLYHTIGCVACHAPLRDPGPSSTEVDSIASAVAVEYPTPSIPSIPIRDGIDGIGFLSKLDPAGMRHMKVTQEEGFAIGAFLVSDDPEVIPESAPYSFDLHRVARGQETFVRIGCARCHLGITPPEEYKRTPILRPDSGCLAESVKSPAVDYGLTIPQRSAIRNALAMDTPRISASWRVLGMAAANNCLACHERDGHGGVEPGRVPHFTTTVDADLGDEGRIPPTLTGVGAKLTPAALKSILTGHGSARPYMATRMPVFDLGDVDAVIEAFTQADRTTITAEVDVTGLERHHRNHYGRELIGTEALGCVSCHELNGHHSLGMPAIDLALAPGRLRPEWFMAYMNDPASLRPGTRMPAYFPEGKSTYPGLFNGNPREQIEAIWIYLREIDQTRLPVGVEDSTQYIVVPKDAPVVHRTFMKDVGARAIAVGFPEGVHFAFDATQVRTSLAWRGDFLDANSTWNDRFSPYVEALSEDRWRFPRVMPFALEEEWPVESGADAGYVFKGYRLDESGTPEFRYAYGDLMIGERITPLSGDKGVRRAFTIENVDTPVQFLVARGAGIEAKDNTYRVNEKWSARVSVTVGRMIVKELKGGMPSVVATFTPEDRRITFVQEIEW
jgi:hypothetical protein